MARPGLEPRTPRFSDRCAKVLESKTKPLHGSGFWGLDRRSDLGRDVRKWHSLVVDVGHERVVVAQ